MSLIIGTRDGVFRSKNDTLNDIEHVLDSGNTLRVRTFENHEGVFAAAKTGLYRSMNDGTTWENLGVPREVFSIVGSPDGTRLFAGTHPAHLYVSTDHGNVWQEIEGFQKLPSRNQWHTPRHQGAQVRSLSVYPDAPEHVIAGVEVGGVHVSEDHGDTWVERRDLQPERHGLHYDVHHILALGAEEYVVSCGGGLYRTRDTGQTWTKLDDNSEQTYFVETFAYQGVLYAGAQGPPWTWNETNGIDAALFESQSDSDTLEAVTYPGESNELVIAWTAANGRVLAGTNHGRVMGRADDGWTILGSVPASIRSITSV